MCVPRIVSAAIVGSQFILCGVKLYPTNNRGPKQVLVLLLNSLEYPSVYILSIFLSCSLSLYSPPPKKQCPTPSSLTSTSSYSPPLVGWLSFPSPLTHIFPCPQNPKGSLQIQRIPLKFVPNAEECSGVDPF